MKRANLSAQVFDIPMAQRCLGREAPVAIGGNAHRWDEAADFRCRRKGLAVCGITPPERPGTR